MDRIWAPWRMQYIELADKTEGCIFCVFPSQDKDRENLLLYRGKTAFMMLNCYPYNPGHLMIAPYKHTSDMCDLSDQELLEVNQLVRSSVRLLTAVMEPHGFNVGINLGRTAGAGIADHIHWHIVPRWDGDTNFMPVIADTKVIPESLLATYDKLKEKMEEIGVD